MLCMTVSAQLLERSAPIDFPHSSKPSSPKISSCAAFFFFFFFPSPSSFGFFAFFFCSKPTACVHNQEHATASDRRHEGLTLRVGRAGLWISFPMQRERALFLPLALARSRVSSPSAAHLIRAIPLLARALARLRVRGHSSTAKPFLSFRRQRAARPPPSWPWPLPPPPLFYAPPPTLLLA